MKSYKAGLFGKFKSRITRSRKQKRNALRRLQIGEQLESRQLMASDWNADIIAATGRFTTEAAREAGINYVASQENGSGSGRAEGFSNTNLLVQEVEPNNTKIFPQHIPLGFDAAGFSGVDFAGLQSGFLDEDYLSFNLAAGDLLDVRLFGGANQTGTISLLDTNALELATSTTLTSVGTAFPLQSPLSGVGVGQTGTAVLNYVIASSGRYLFRISDLTTQATSIAAYIANFRVYRSSYESVTANAKQIVFLDFNGEFVSNRVVGLGGTGTGRLSPLSSSLAGYGLAPTDEGPLIDAITRRVQAKFDFVAARGNNPNFGIDIRNSKDHSDPWGLPEVSRVVFGQ